MQILVAGAMLVPLAGCGSSGFADINGFTKFAASTFGVGASPRVTHSRYVKKGGGRAMIGKSYKVAGKWYTPRYDPGYDQAGMASWYGPNFHGRLTANGEVFDQYALTAAHPTMPLPSYARVTNLENGRSVIVRVNDRGPFIDSRLIDVSSRAAELLGFRNKGSERVRVQYVGPAPLEGDDTRILMASLNAPSPLEAGRSDVRVAYADTAPVPTPLPALGQRTASDAPTNLLGYAGAAPDSALVNDAVAAAEAMASEASGLSAWRAAHDADARRVDIELGVFSVAQSAMRISEAFALLGAVEGDSVDVGGREATGLKLTYLKPGVTQEDVLDLATRLGLGDVTIRR